MTQRLNHVSAMIAKFDLTSSSPEKNKAPPVAPKPCKKSPGFSAVDATDAADVHLSDNDAAAEVSIAKPSKRVVEWPPKKNSNEEDESQEESQSHDSNADDCEMKEESCPSPQEESSPSPQKESSPSPQKEESRPSQKEETSPIISVTNASNDEASDDESLNAATETASGELNLPNLVHSDICDDSSSSSACGDEVDDATSKASSTSQSDTSKPKRSYTHIIDEIVKTERTFVEDLKFLHECYQVMAKVNSEKKLELEKQIEDVFSDFVPIFKLHSETFLPIMEKNYAGESEFWVGRVFNENQFIVKTYKPFIVKQHENEKTLMELTKNPLISEAVEEVMKKYKKLLGCTNDYNVIFQRITRYSLLLKEYIKHLPDNCPDRAVAMMAMGKIHDAATQLNETKRNAEDFNTQVLNALDRIAKGRQLELQPWEKFIKEGPVEKISARSITRVQPRYLFLFSGRLLLCESSITAYVIKTQIEVATMQIEEINDTNKHPNSFRLRGKQKTFDLKFDSEETENEWRDALSRVIAADRARRESFMRVGLTEENKRILGKQAPLWIKDQDASMCMQCCGQFTFNNRRHHCRACGKLVCGTCSNYKHNLAYLNNAAERVCRLCKETLSRSDEDAGKLDETSTDLAVSAIESYLYFADSTRQFQEKYAILREEGWIELKKKCKDGKPWKTIPIVGYTLNSENESDLCFKLSHPACEYFLKCKNKGQYDDWIAKIQEVLQEFQ